MIQLNAKQFVPAVCLLYSQMVAAQSATIALTIDANTTFQTIDNFGASDAWACQFVGNWPDAKKNAIADWLFSLDTMSNGNPKGIGLSLWRFNLGAGSSQQANASGIKDEWRRAGSFLETDGSYNWNRQAGEQWFLTAARQRGVNNFLAFYNSPPVQFTKNKQAFAAVKGQSNIDSTQYTAWAAYTVKALAAIQQKHAIRFNYISPINEPQWDWSDGGQEGCPFTNQQISGAVKALSRQLQQHKLPTKILLGEAGNIKYLLKEDDKPGKGNQVNDFWQRASPNYVGNLVPLAKVIAGHSYFSTAPYQQSVTLRKELATRVAAVNGLTFWQTEYCILGDNEGEISGNKRDTGMQSALYLARTLHTDLAIANAAAWQWWLAISPYDYKDGLIYIDKSKTDGNYYDSKMLWALGNYSRFIRPGMQRVAASFPATTTDCFVSAYRDSKLHKLVAVIVNTGKATYSLNIQLPAGKRTKHLTQMTSYTTGVSSRLARQQVTGSLDIQPESIVTLVIPYQ
ncbi:glycoside hydrolase [Paraflavitalea speifideaquila]|uniref:glycoside hydrolase n=1 Tax=Paraflavitalea speifideaquila TaxID=3076558 RepID=UPI0028F0F765|nr:glycoside hydrolase [Paraflavitalea speifideiaquila]